MKNNLIFLYPFAGFTENLEAGMGGASGGWWEFTNLSSKMMNTKKKKMMNTKDTLLVQFSCCHVRLCDPMDGIMPGLPVHHQLP